VVAAKIARIAAQQKRFCIIFCELLFVSGFGYPKYVSLPLQKVRSLLVVFAVC